MTEQADNPLPACRWRSKIREDGSFLCASSCVVVFDMSSAERTCRACPLPDKDCRDAAESGERRAESKPAPKLTGGPGSELVAIFKGLGISGCEQCYELAARMDAWGVDGCQQRLDQIVDEILPRANLWAAQRWLKSLAPGFALRTVIRIHVVEAIRRAKRAQSTSQRINESVP